MNAAVTARGVGHSADGVRVVRVDSGENVVVAVANGGEVAVEHLADNAVLMPQRHQNGDRTLRLPKQVPLAWPRETAARVEEVNERDE
jgi:hypothetical protein